MAKLVGDTGVWPPSRFDGTGKPNADFDAAFGFPSEFPYEFGVSSPAVESVAGSTEAESSDEEEDFFAGLTRRLSHETRKQLPIKPDDLAFSEIPTKSRVMAGSPQSTLSGIGSWSGRSGVSGDGSPNGYSRVPSPSTTSFHDNNDPWDVIYSAAAQVARLKINNNNLSEFDFHNRGLLGHPRTTHGFNQVQHQMREKQQCGLAWARQIQTQTHTKPNWLVQQQQLQVQNRGHEFGYDSVKCTRPVSLPQNVFPSNRVQFGGSGSRAGVPGGSIVKKGSGGTGVFLPRHYETPSESRKKTGCAPVLVPAKVVHGLNLNIDELNVNVNVTGQPRFSNAFATEYDALLARRNALLMQQRLLNLRREEAAARASYEVRLPQEWTY